MVRTHMSFQVWVPHRGFGCGWPAGVSVVSPQSANLGACYWASGECWGCFSAFTVQGLRGRGARGRGCCREFSNSLLCASIFFLFLRNSSYSATLFQTSTWLLTQPSLALSQESCHRPCTPTGASAALVPWQVPGTFLSLSILVTIRSFNVLYLWSPIFIYGVILLAVRSVPQIS